MPANPESIGKTSPIRQEYSSSRMDARQKEIERMTTQEASQRPGQKLVFRAFITLKNGKRLYAAAIGKKAFPIWVPDK